MSSNLFETININGISITGPQAQPNQMYPQQFSGLVNQGFQVHPEIKPLLPNIGAYVYNHVAQKAMQNAPRVAHFNMMISQNNSELFILISLVTNMAWLRVKNGAFANLDQAIPQCTEWIVTRRVNYITMNVPELLTTVQNDAGTVRLLAEEYITEVHNTLNEMSQIYIGGTTGFRNNAQQPANNNNGMAVTGFGSQNNNNGGFAGATAATGFGAARSGGGSVIVRSNDNSGPRGDRFSDDLLMGDVTDVKPREVSQAAAPAAPAPKPSSVLENMDKGLEPGKQVVKEELPTHDDKGQLLLANLPSTNARWTPNRYQLHPLCFDDRKFNLERRLFKENGKTFVIDVLRNNQDMDRNAHSLPTSAQFLAEIKQADSTRAEHREKTLIHGSGLLKTVRAINVEAEVIARTEEIRQQGHMVFRSGFHSLEEALSHSRQVATMCSKHEFGIYISEFFMQKDFVTFKSDAEILQGLSKARSIAALADDMKALIQDPHSSHSLRVALVQINAYLAKCWMEWIRFYLCMDEFSGSDSFIDDVMAIRQDIQEVEGPVFAQMIDSNQQRFIQTYLAFGTPFEPSFANLLNDGDKPIGDPDREVVVTPVLTPSVLVCTEFLDSEYNLKFSSDIDGRDIASNFDATSISPAFLKLVQTMLEQPRSLGLQGQIRRFYIATLDNVVYEVNMGLSKATPSVLIKKVH